MHYFGSFFQFSVFYKKLYAIIDSKILLDEENEINVKIIVMQRHPCIFYKGQLSRIKLYIYIYYDEYDFITRFRLPKTTLSTVL